MNAELKKRREEKVRNLFRDPRRMEADWKEWRYPPTRKQLVYKVTICIMIYVLLWGVFRLDHPYAIRIESTVRGYLTDSYDFTSAADWLDQHVGLWPAFLPAFDPNRSEGTGRAYTIPASGAIVSPYSATGQGIWLSTRPSQSVMAIGTGLVESVLQNPDTGLTVVVRHADGIRSIYGWLGSASVENNDWLKGGAEIGKVRANDGETGKLYFAVMRNKTYIDPGDVIPLD